MASYRGVSYTGVTSDLVRRVYEHRHKLVEGFTKQYNVSKLVYYEATNEIEAAIAREKQIKGWLRKKKVVLIESMNPSWVDLGEELYDSSPITPDPSLCSG
jgi:putative endonuclease